MIDKLYEKLIDPQAMLAAMKETLRQIDPQYSKEEAAFFDGIEALRAGLPSDHPVSLDAYLEEYREAGYPMVSHSEQYRRSYNPAYRIVLTSIFSKENP